MKDACFLRRSSAGGRNGKSRRSGSQGTVGVGAAQGSLDHPLQTVGTDDRQRGARHAATLMTAVHLQRERWLSGAQAHPPRLLQALVQSLEHRDRSLGAREVRSVGQHPQAHVAAPAACAPARGEQEYADEEQDRG